MNFANILARTPVNKTAKVVINQCGCSDFLELNGLIEERKQLKLNVKAWIREGKGNYGRRVVLRPCLKKGNIRLGELNGILRPYDEHHRQNKPKSLNDAIVLIMRETLDEETCSQIERQAKRDFYND